MTPKTFDEANTDFYAARGDVKRMPGHMDHRTGVATFCWELTKEELKALAETGLLWTQVKTFGAPLQPQALSVAKPEVAA